MANGESGKTKGGKFGFSFLYKYLFLLHIIHYEPGTRSLITQHAHTHTHRLIHTNILVRAHTHTHTHTQHTHIHIHT